MRRKQGQSFHDWLEEEQRDAILEQDRTLAAAKVRDIATDSGAPQAHKDSHDPNDGSDPLDCAAAAAIAGVQAAAEGSAHSFARSDHAHAIGHSIADNALVTVDDADAASGDYCKLTASGIQGRDATEVRSDINVADGADVTGSNAPQAHKDSHDPADGSDPLDTANAASIAGVQAAGTGTAHSLARSDHAHGIAHSIANNALVTIDHAAVADNDYAKFTASGLEGRSYAELMGDLSGQAAADFAMNTHKITGVVDPAANQDAATKKYVDDNAGTDNDLDPTPDSDHTVSGLTATLTAGTGLIFGQACYIGADSKMELTDADAEATSRCVALCAANSIAENVAGSFLLQGFARDDTWTWTVGGKVYLSCTAGALTQTAPSATGDCIVVVGIATHADRLYFNPSVQAIVEHV